MKKLLFMFFVFFNLIVVPSCHDDDEKEYKIKYEVISNTAGAPIYVYNWGITVKDYWCKEEVSDRSYSHGLKAQCDDPDVLITLNLYVNGKLQASREGNGRVFVHN